MKIPYGEGFTNGLLPDTIDLYATTEGRAMSNTIDQVLIDDGVIKVRQGEQLVRVIRVRQTNGDLGGRFIGKVRCTAYRDYYDFQSHYKAEVWASNSWKGVVSLDGTDPWAKSETLEHVCERLLADAKLVLLL